MQKARVRPKQAIGRPGGKTSICHLTSGVGSWNRNVFSGSHPGLEMLGIGLCIMMPNCHGKISELAPFIHLELDWRAAWTLRISTNGIAWFHWIRPKGFILRSRPWTIVVFRGVLGGRNLAPKKSRDVVFPGSNSQHGSDSAHSLENGHF